MIVFMYPGQGSQKSGMGEAWVDHPSWELVTEASETSDRDLVTLYRAETARAQAAEAKRLNGRLQDNLQRPDAWQAYLQQRLARLNEAMQAVPRRTDLPGAGDVADESALLARFRDYAGGFASGLRGWNALRDAAAHQVKLMLDRGELQP